ncbi:MAG TPA: SDR family NAD(P)-dependent oxidoreductase [Bacteroidia bacterium]|nr:SDR family NAD(P)-dependent oxidoreductase [Bacteroidia bacterium]
MKTAVITGGNSGIGKATAIALSTLGYRVIIHGRDAIKTAQAVTEINAHSRNKNVDAVTGDMSTIAGMKKVASEIQKLTDIIDVLVLSTGVIYSKRVTTSDGLDTPFVTQYLCRFAMVQELFPLLNKAESARIVHVGAPTMKKAQVFFDDLALKNNFTMMTSMGQAMLSCHLFVQEFSKRHPDNKITMNIMHVGISKTGIAREISWLFRTMINTFGTSPEKACRNAVFLADNKAANFSGYFLPTPGKPEKKEKISFDPKLAEKLWETSEKLIQ